MSMINKLCEVSNTTICIWILNKNTTVFLTWKIKTFPSTLHNCDSKSTGIKFLKKKSCKNISQFYFLIYNSILKNNVIEFSEYNELKISATMKHIYKYLIFSGVVSFWHTKWFIYILSKCFSIKVWFKWHSQFAQTLF